MIPSVVAAEVAGALGDFLATGFGPSNPALAHVVDDFLAEPENLAKGPYLSIALPFEPAAEGGEPFPEVPLGFTPYRHQRTAFSRLAAGAGRSTVVATGTGSGKTECFLFPILDHCRERAGVPGVKAILVYPMNALAADQARRIAQTIDRTPALRRRVTAGVFVGRDNQPQRSAHKTMGRDHVVTDRDTLRERPPDILLTNYKMLDYLLVRPFDFRLWRRNRPETLRYLVVDELHTFDGAQGTDLACLIRRLRVRLGVPRDKLICAGTSATLGDADDEAGLRAYASRIFDQPFEPGAVVGEVRQSIDAFLGGAIISRHLHAADDLAARVDPTRHPTAEAYLRAQHELFFGTPIEGGFASDGWRLALGERLREHAAFVNLLRVLDGRPTPMPAIVARLRHSLPVANDREALGVLNGLCALVSVARRREGAGGGGGLRPFLQVGLHLWVRELRRMVCSLHDEAAGGSVEEAPERSADRTNDAEEATGGSVEGAPERRADGTNDAEEATGGAVETPERRARATNVGEEATRGSVGEAPERRDATNDPAAVGAADPTGAGRVPRRLRFFDDLKPDEPSVHMPLVQCRECHVTGWGAVKRPAEPQLDRDLRVFYNRFFLRDIDVAYLFPAPAPPGVRGFEVTVCGACGAVGAAGDATCAGCRSERLVRVFRPVAVEPRGRGGSRSARLSRDCPYCGAREALIIVGARAASLLSVALGQAQGSRYNDDRKVIAFSDNVQDAAHRAGFFAARTAGTAVRAAVAQVVGRHDGIALADLPKRVETWWRDTTVNPRAFDDERFVSEFIAPDRLWRRDFVTLQREGRLPAGSRLPEAVAERLRWDTLAELGYRSAIGRTLERTRAAAVGADRDALERACDGAHIRIREKLGGLRDLPPVAVRALLLGVLRRMKDRGAIRSAVAAAWLAAGGGRWWLSRRPALQDFGPRSARPVFPVDAPHAADGIEPLFSRNGGRKSWYQAWVERVLTPVDVLAATREAPDVLLEALGALEAAGLVCRIDAGRAGRAWALEPARFYATARTAVMRCAGSSRSLVVPEPEADLWIGAPCLDLGVQAVYDRRAAEPPTWFGRLYRETLVRRLGAAEHTALLTRDERDRLQRRFSHPYPRPWEPNLLSATPTLELGIDVGDLSTVVLCSVPPAQANYLQRIGRAGRRDGNAFTATVAAGQPHDLYFYAEPLAMLAGRIEPPGVFLNAPAVLERQLTAFCLDAWAATGLPDDAVPRTVRHVLDNVEQVRLTGFPYPFLDFVQRRGDDLLQAFFDALAGELTAQSRDYLAAFLQGGTDFEGGDPSRLSLRFRLVSRFHEMAGERKALRADVDALGRRIQGLKRAPQDEAAKTELAGLARERGGLQGLLRKLNGRETFNFLTDEGLLPNYAFPEARVTLKSVIYRSRERDGDDDGAEDGGRDDERDVYEYVRPAASALGELAPENEFYAGGNRVSIDRIDLRVSSIETWRLCPSCDHCARVDTGDDEAACPRCGDVMWSDTGQRREMVPLRMVHAATRDRRARIVDERDEREPLFYTRQLAADFEPAAVKRAYATTGTDTPFGFEYIETATFREMNFGRLGTGGQPVAFAGLALPRDGFRVCRRCGKVQKRGGDDRAEHTSTCGARQDEQADIADCLYLYREFSSEAVQMLLPVLDAPGSERRVSSFVAALELGLRRHFSGRIDHLRATTRRSPRPTGAPGGPATGTATEDGSDRRTAPRTGQFRSGSGGPAAGTVTEGGDGDGGGIRRTPSRTSQPQTGPGAAPEDGGGGAHQYLLLYDTVPSGTGYLKELMTEPAKLLSVFEKARDALRSCVCNQDPEKDGCYRCVFAYRRSREMAETSRDTAIEMLDRILARRDALAAVPSLGGLTVNAAFDSELEARFVEALRRVEVDGARAVHVRADLVGGKPGYVLRVGAHTWYMETQADLGASDGVVERSRPDFLIRPARPAPGRPPVAVFTDGFEFHRDATDDDSVKRMALVRAGFLVWSLTWHDLEPAFGGAPDVPDLLAGARAGDDMAAVQRRLDARWGTAGLRSRLVEPTLILLVSYLRAPEPDRWKQAVFTALFGLFDRQGMFALRAAFDRAAADALPGQVRDALRELPRPVAVAGAGAWTGAAAEPRLIEVEEAADVAGTATWTGTAAERRLTEAEEVADVAGAGAWTGTAAAAFDLFAALPLAAVEQGDPDAAAVVVHLHDDEASRHGDGYRRVWNGVLRLFTLLQFLPGTWWTTRVGVERGVYPEFAPVAEGQTPPGPAPDLPAGDWRDAAELGAPEVHDLLRELAARGAPPPEVGFELAGTGGAVLAEAELAWPAHRVAVLPANRRADVAAFEAAGWRAFTTGAGGPVDTSSPSMSGASGSSAFTTGAGGLVETLADLLADGTVPPEGSGGAR